MTQWTIFLFFTAVLASTVVHGQTTPNDTTYYQDSIKVVLKKINSKEYSKTTFYSNGQKRSEGIYKNTLFFNKPPEYVRSVGHKPRRQFYREDAKIGLWTYWYPNGQKQEEDWNKRGYLKKCNRWTDSGQVVVLNQKSKKTPYINHDPQRQIGAHF